MDISYFVTAQIDLDIFTLIVINSLPNPGRDNNYKECHSLEIRRELLDKLTS